MNTDEAILVLAKAYAIPEEALLAQITAVRGESGTTPSDLALAAWLREQAQQYERGMGHYGNPIHPETLSTVALFRLAAERLEKRAKEAALLNHIDWLARGGHGTDVWTIKIPDSENAYTLIQAAQIDANKGIAMA